MKISYAKRCCCRKRHSTARAAPTRCRYLPDPILPKEIQLQRCRHCDGIWLNRGQFHRYKDYQRGTRAVKMSEEKIVAKLPEVYANPKSWVVTGTKGIYAYPRGEEDDGADLVAKSFGSTAKLVLQSLVRMILGI